ncbi:hypothetical protein Cni_G26294 [Canna indica]|uniref:DUF4283 domain-containing protein n=1 Tax=Canna indica TaxID=4628 RepID=A0AAQ3L3F7_9LILI|nr:hypothetical protein Cni_G26294 [Canna indica]
MARKEEEWHESRELNAKIGKIQGSAKGIVFIAEEDLEAVRNLMPKIWNLKFGCQIVDLSAGFFAFKFANEDEYWNVFLEGPWFIRGQALSLIQWKEGFQPMKEVITVVPIWIQMPGLPYEFMHKTILPQIATTVGKTIKIDGHTLSGEREWDTLRMSVNWENTDDKEKKESNDMNRVKENRKEEIIFGPWIQPLKMRKKRRAGGRK